MHTKPWHFLLVFVAGILVGAIIQRHYGYLLYSAEHCADQPLRTKSSRRETESSQSQVEARIRSEIAGWSKSDGDAQKQKWLSEVPLKDIPIALRLLREKDGWVNRDLLIRWWEADADAAWKWAEALQEGTHRNGLGILLVKLSESDPMGALARAVSYQKTDCEFDLGWEVGLVLKYQLAKSEKPADEFLAILASLPRKDERRPLEYVHYEFPSGFDFQHFMDGLGRMNGNLPEVMPSDVLSSWAKVDPDAANAWVLANKPFNYVQRETWGKVLNSVSEQRGQEEAAQWAAEKYKAADDAGRLRIADELVTLGAYGETDPNTVLEIAENLESTTQASNFIRQVMRHEWASLEDQKGMDFKLLRSFATPAERVDVIAEIITTVPKQEYEEPKDRLECIPERHLQILGVTREQIQQAVIARGGSTVR